MCEIGPNFFLCVKLVSNVFFLKNLFQLFFFCGKLVSIFFVENWSFFGGKLVSNVFNCGKFVSNIFSQNWFQIFFSQNWFQIFFPGKLASNFESKNLSWQLVAPTRPRSANHFTTFPFF